MTWITPDTHAEFILLSACAIQCSCLLP